MGGEQGLIWFSADWHIGHERILELCNRPFPDVLSMRTTILANLDRLVRPNDSLYILGDMAWNPQEWAALYDELDAMPFELFCLAGNHDCQHIKKTMPWALKVKYDRHTFYLCHFPWASWMPHTLMLHAHSHGRLPKIPHRVDVGVDVWNFCPVSAQQIIESEG